MSDHPPINTGLGSMSVSDVVAYIRSETERDPTPSEPRDSSVLLGMLRALPTKPLNLPARVAIWFVEESRDKPHLYEIDTAKKLLREARMILYAPLHEEPGEWVCFGDFSRKELGKQAQYGSRYLHGDDPQYLKLLDDDAMIQGNPWDYHSVRIHVDAIPDFLAKYREYRSIRA